MKIWG